MRVFGLLLLVVGACQASSSTQQQQQEATRFQASTWAARLSRLNRNLARRVEFRSDSPGTETVLLVKGGVGVDVDLRQDLLSTKNIFKKPQHHTIKGRLQPKRAAPAASVTAHIAKSEAKKADAVDEEVASVYQAADVAQKLAQQLKHEAKQVEATKKEYRKVQKENVGLKEKLAKEEAALKLAEAEVASQKKQNAEFVKEKKALWGKVRSLDEDLRITNEAWKERAEVEENELEAEEKQENSVLAAKKATPVATTKKTGASKKSAAAKTPQKNSATKVVPKMEQTKTTEAAKKDATMKKETTKFSDGLKAALTRAIASVAQSVSKKASTPKKLAPLPPAPAAGEHNEKQDESEDDLDDDEDNEDEDAPEAPPVQASVDDSEEDDSDSEKGEDDGSDE